MLLDTHIWLWYAEGDAEQLADASVKRLDDVRRSDGLLISAISVWEIGVQHATGRIQLSAPLRDWVHQALSPAGVSLLPIDADIAAESTLLPGEPHGDPADRLLIATARLRGVTLATRDHDILEYGKSGWVRAERM
jgi:PIN domain nuclease of toxin-antitoxin system